MNQKLLSLVLLTTFCLLGASFGIANAQAQSNSTAIQQIQNELNSLYAQLLQAQQQQSGSQEWCHTFNTNLGFAQSGSAEVGYLHTALDNQSISYSPDTGNTYSQGTEQAVVVFQERYRSEILAPWNLTQGTGFVGATTRAKLNQLYGCNNQQTSQDNSALIQQAQNQLNSLTAQLTQMQAQQNTQQTTACTTSSSCGTSGYTGSPFCQSGNSYQNYITHTCSNSSCTSNTTARLKQTCSSSQLCWSGICTSELQTNTCTTSSSCGTSGYTGSPFCQSGNSYQNYITYTCTNSSCTSNTTARLKQTCLSGQSCNAGACGGSTNDQQITTSCIPNWQCRPYSGNSASPFWQESGIWSSCTNGFRNQRQEVFDLNNCGLSAFSTGVSCSDEVRRCNPPGSYGDWPSVKIVSPNGGETYKNFSSPLKIRWNVPDYFMVTSIGLAGWDIFKVHSLKLKSQSSGQEYDLAGYFDNRNDGEEEIRQLPQNIPAGSYKLEIKLNVGQYGKDSEYVVDESDAPFTILSSDTTQKTISVSGPANGSTISPFQPNTVTWIHSGALHYNVDILMAGYNASGQQTTSWKLIASSVLTTQKSYNWTQSNTANNIYSLFRYNNNGDLIPSPAKYKLKIIEATKVSTSYINNTPEYTSGAVFGISSGFFTIPHYCEDLQKEVSANLGKKCGDINYNFKADIDRNGAVSSSDNSLVQAKNVYTQQNETWCKEKLDIQDNPCNNLTSGTTSNTSTSTSTSTASSQCDILYNRLNSSNNSQCGAYAYDPTADIDKSGTVNNQDFFYFNRNKTNLTWCQDRLKEGVKPCSFVGKLFDLRQSVVVGTRCGNVKYNPIVDVNKNGVIDAGEGSSGIPVDWKHLPSTALGISEDSAIEIMKNTINPCNISPYSFSGFCSKLYSLASVGKSVARKCGQNGYSLVGDVNKDGLLDNKDVIMSSVTNEASCLSMLTNYKDPCFDGTTSSYSQSTTTTPWYGNVNISGKSIYITSPVGGETLTIGQQALISWNPQGFILGFSTGLGDSHSINVYLKNDATNEPRKVIATNIVIPTYSNAFYWTPTATYGCGNQFKVILESTVPDNVQGISLYSESNNYFSITGCQ